MYQTTANQKKRQIKVIIVLNKVTATVKNYERNRVIPHLDKRNISQECVTMKKLSTPKNIPLRYKTQNHNNTSNKQEKLAMPQHSGRC